MPTTTVTINTADRRDVRALRILQGARSWLKLVVDVPGLGERRFYGIPSESEPDVFRKTNLRQCDCQDFLNRQDGGRFTCAHMRAVRMYVEIVAQEKRRKDALAAQLARARENGSLGDNVRVVGGVEAF
jgi:predicted nucleic acid-binding Zn finger protein